MNSRSAVRIALQRRIVVRLGSGVAAAIAAMVCVLSAQAYAGVYTVSGCRTGWVPDVRNTSGGAVAAAFDQCDHSVRSLSAGLPWNTTPRANAGDYGGWRFDAPANTVIGRLSLTWDGRGDYAAGDWGAAVVSVAASNNPELAWHIEPFAANDRFAIQDASWVRFFVVCQAQAGSTCRTSWVDPSTGPDTPHVAVQRASVSIVDSSAPVVSNVSGDALGSTVWSAPESLSFAASDAGGGVFETEVEVDGGVMQTLPAVSDGRCRDLTGSRDFAYPVPCPSQASASVVIDPAVLPEGHHTVGVYVIDAGGNRAIVMPPTDKVIVNDYRAVGYFANGAFLNPRYATPRVLNGNGATSGAKLSAALVRQVGKGRARHRVRRVTREVRYSQRATVRGTLATPSGDPISNATIFIGQRPEGQQWRIDGSARTNARGEFVYRPAARQPSRRLRAIYFPFSDSHENVASGALTLNVRAGMTLRVNRHSLHNGDRLVFSGRVLGPVPQAGIAITLQAKVGAHYRSFRQLRVTGRGNGGFRTVYRFERTTRPARYRFRLKVVRQAGLPFEGGVSPVVTVSVRP